MYRLVIFLDDLEAKTLEKMAKNEFRDIRSQEALVLREDLVYWNLLHLDDKGGESQEIDNRVESKRIQSINMEIQKERKQCQ
jgi:hypothetical protein